jgi:hypothetical protein
MDITALHAIVDYIDTPIQLQWEPHVQIEALGESEQLAIDVPAVRGSV